MIKSLLIVGIGSFFGGALRYFISTAMKSVCGQGFPWGTLLVNLLGSLMFGVLFALFSKNNVVAAPWCLLLTTGLCGGFTTYSTFAHEGVQMLQSGQHGAFFAYLALSLVGGFSLIALGYLFIK